MLFNEGGSAADRDLTARVDMLSPDAVPTTARRSSRASRPAKVRASCNAPDAAGGWLKDRLINLSVMYRATQAISHVLDIDALLPQILELVFESISADRGAILLKDEAGSPRPQGRPLARRGADPDERMTISRTIVDHVLEQGQGVITSDAPGDKRFGPAQSIVDFGIREAICVPIQGRHVTLGVLYADIRTVGEFLPAIPRGKEKDKDATRSRFSQDHLMLMVAIGHQAGLAIENTVFYKAKLQAERLAAVGQTIATLSHHIKNILQGIRGGSYLIDMGLKEKDEAIVRRGWTIVEKNQAKIYNLVMDMLSFSKDREPALEPADLNETVADVVELMQSRARELGVELAWQPRPEDAPGPDRPRRHPPRGPEHRDQRDRRRRGGGRGPGDRLDRVGRREALTARSRSPTTASASPRRTSARSSRSSPRPRGREAPGWGCPSRRRSSASTAARSSSPPRSAKARSS